MKPRTLVLIVALAAALSVGLTLRPQSPDVITGAEESPPTVRVAGVMVNSPVGGEDPFPDLAFMGTFERTRVALQLDAPEGGLIDLQREQSTLELFADDRGRNLIDLEDSFGPFEMMARRLADGRRLVFVVKSPTLPGPGARELRLRGEAAVMVADGTVTSRTDSLELTTGAQATAGGFTLTVQGQEPSDWSEGHTLTLSSTQDLSTVVRWALVDAAGVEVELSPAGSMSGMGTWQQYLSIEQPIEGEVVLVLEHWDQPEIQRFPFDVTVGMGLR